MSENQSIKETLDIIRKALEEDDPPKISEDFDNLLVLNQLVREDGTIKIFSLILSFFIGSSFSRAFLITFNVSLIDLLSFIYHIIS